MRLGAVDRGRLARTELFVNLDKTFLNVVSLILFDSSLHALVVAEEIEDLGVGSQTEGADKRGDGQLAVFIYTNIEHVINVGFVLQPRAPVGDYGSGKQLLTCFVVIHFIVNARGTDKLRYDNALSTVYYKGSAWSHKRKIAHIYIAFLDFARRLVEQSGSDAQSR